MYISAPVNRWLSARCPSRSILRAVCRRPACRASAAVLYYYYTQTTGHRRRWSTRCAGPGRARIAGQREQVAYATSRLLVRPDSQPARVGGKRGLFWADVWMGENRFTRKMGPGGLGLQERWVGAGLGHPRRLRCRRRWWLVVPLAVALTFVMLICSCSLSPPPLQGLTWAARSRRSGPQSWATGIDHSQHESTTNDVAASLNQVGARIDYERRLNRPWICLLHPSC